MINKLSILLVAGLLCAYGPCTAQDAIKGSPASRAYGRNIIRVFPIKVLDVGGIGIGLGYERIVGSAQNVGVVVPLTYVFGFDNGDLGGAKSYVYFNPGIKIYPFGQRRVNYAVGPSVFIGYSNSIYKEMMYPINGRSYVEEQKMQQIKLGAIVNNYLNIQLGKNYNFGIELGLGVRYIDRTKLERQDRIIRDGLMATGNFGMSFGYRF